MSQKYGNWHEYQEAVASVFREIGCSVEVDKKVKGTRGQHDIDVYVTFEKFGQVCRWIIECKLWSTRIPKSEVLTLYSIGTSAQTVDSSLLNAAFSRARSQRLKTQTSSCKPRSRTSDAQYSCTYLVSPSFPKIPTSQMRPFTAFPLTIANPDYGRLFVGTGGFLR